MATSTGSPHSHSGSPVSPKRVPTGETIADALSVEEYGRLFNAYREDSYLLPNDGDEQDRLDLQHNMWLIMLDGHLSVAPIGEPASVLDIGTGTGIWAKQFARTHPTSQVVGTDISLIQTAANLPPNVTFEREDSEELWVFDHPFDYIHWRAMCTCFNDFPGMIARVFQHLTPNGWAEFHDFAFELVGEDEAAETLLQGSAIAQLFRCAISGGAAKGKDFESGRKLKGWMIEAGFVDVVQRQIFLPLNAWPLDRKDNLIGKWWSLDLLKALDGLTKLVATAGMPLEEIPDFTDRVRLDITNRNMRVYAIAYVVYGRKAAGSSSTV